MGAVSRGLAEGLEAAADTSVVEAMIEDDVDGGNDDLLAAGNRGSSAEAVLSAYALRTVVTPSNVFVDPQSTKVS
jgi:hypothetical protein